eukprot:745652-Hanusia_phi.AAC.3
MYGGQSKETSSRLLHATSTDLIRAVSSRLLQVPHGLAAELLWYKQDIQSDLALHANRFESIHSSASQARLRN